MYNPYTGAFECRSEEFNFIPRTNTNKRLKAMRKKHKKENPLQRKRLRMCDHACKLLTKAIKIMK